MRVSLLCSINSNNLMNTSITSFVSQFPAVLEEYKKRLKSDPGLQLKAVCVEMGVKYSRMIDWTYRQGIFVRKLQAEDRGEKPLAGISQAFIQFSPSGHHSSFRLRGVSITYPDGVNLTLQESSVESIISLLTIYRSRRGGANPCSD